ncbi:MAG TPA: hypothetical protein VHO47_04570 [Candidatus Babeliales bacterium]|nr:hypothetical protein [Candidatus Babeliales bacterium]
MRTIKAFLVIALIAQPLQAKLLNFENQTTAQKIALGAGTLGYLGYLGYKYYSCKKEVAENKHLIKQHEGKGTVPVPKKIEEMFEAKNLASLAKNPNREYRWKPQVERIQTEKRKFVPGCLTHITRSLCHPFVVENLYITVSEKDPAQLLIKSNSQGEDSDASAIEDYGQNRVSLHDSKFKVNGWKAAVLIQASIGLGLLCQQAVRLMGK